MNVDTPLPSASLCTTHVPCNQVYNERIYNLLEGVTSEDGYASIPHSVRPVNPPKARFSRGTFEEIESDTKVCAVHVPISMGPEFVAHRK